MAEESKTLSVDEKVALITRNLEDGEVLGLDEMKAILAERDLKVYWGTATTGAPHVAYFVPLSKIADFLKAGCEVTILFADLHAYLDNLKSSWELLDKRVEYYQLLIKQMLISIGVPIDKLKYVRGTEYQLSREYTLDVYKLSAKTGILGAKKAGAEVVKQSDNPLLSGVLYPLLQALDEEYLHVDAQFGGVDQRKIFAYARDNLPAIGYKKRIHLMNPMVPGLAKPIVSDDPSANKMSSSNPNSKIDLMDSAKVVVKKIKAAFCEEGNIEHNGVLSFVKYVLFPLKSNSWLVERPEQYGGNVTYATYQEMEDAFAKKELFPADLKKSVCRELNNLMEPVRKHFEKPELQKLLREAYPEKYATESTSTEKKVQLKDKDLPGDVTELNLRVGKVTSIKVHEQNEKLYVANVDLAESNERQIVIGLAANIPADQMKDRLVVVLANIRTTNFRGERSEGMVLGAYDEKTDTAELVDAPEGSVIGERVEVDGFTAIDSDILPNHNPKKKWKFDKYAKDMATDGSKVVTYKGAALKTSAGAVTVKTIVGGLIK